MSRVLLLLIIMLWMAQVPSDPAPRLSLLNSALFFLAGYLLLVAVLGVWSRVLTSRLSGANLRRSVRGFNRSVDAARYLIPIWFGVGLFFLDWKLVVYSTVVPGRLAFYETPAAIVGTLPAFLAWMGLWWAQFPADRAIREQNLLIQLDAALPVFPPPDFRSYFSANLRLQLLFTTVPVLLILATRDVAGALLHPVIREYSLPVRSAVDAAVMFGTAGLIFLLAPEILRHVLQTSRLPDSPLRQRLESMCRRHNLGYRDILLWHTQGNMGNAAVMGVLPRLRYVLLSDLLIESMSDEQIEAVFAHELGHIVHRHMLWYVCFIVILMFTLAGPVAALEPLLPRWYAGDLATAASLLGGTAIFLLSFGYVSRRFERQADVFAARTITPPESATGNWELGAGNSTHVAPHGATVFASALHRVADVNNVPVTGWSWCHGSMSNRMDYLHSLSRDPAHTRRFDQVMRRLYWTLLLALLVTGAWTLHASLAP